MNIESLRDYAVLDGERLQALWEDRDRLREGLELAREWLEGWGSAEPYIARIDALLEQGGAVAAREAHNLEVGGSNPSPASIERDAARYRWLRSADPSTANAELIPTLDLTALDDGIDAAMAASGRNS